MTVFDASVLIAHLERGDQHRDAAARIMKTVVDAPILVSTMTLAEVLVAPARTGVLGSVEQALRRLGVRDVPLGPDAAGRLARLRAHTNLKLPDCCVLLAAEDVEAGSVATFDDRLAAAVRDRGLRVLGAAA